MKKFKFFIDFFKNTSEKLTPKFRNLIDASWNKYEQEKLDKLGFKFNTFKSEISNKIIEIEKFYDEDFPGYVHSVYGVTIINCCPRETSHKGFEDFEEFFNYITDNIPEIELDVKNYNL